MKRNLHVQKPRKPKNRKVVRKPVVAPKPVFNSVVEVIEHLKAKDKKITRNDLHLLYQLCKLALNPLLEVRHIIQNKELIARFNVAEKNLFTTYARECLSGYQKYEKLIDEIYAQHKDVKGKRDDPTMMFDALTITTEYNDWVTELTANVLDTSLLNIVNLIGTKEDMSATQAIPKAAGKTLDFIENIDQSTEVPLD